MESKRQQKYSRMIQKELGAIFQRNLTHQLGSIMVSVTMVRMSPDLGTAKVYLSFVLEQEASAAMDRINRYKSDVRRELGKKIGKQVRIIPELIFYHDDSASYANKIDSLLSKLKIPGKDQDNEE